MAGAPWNQKTIENSLPGPQESWGTLTSPSPPGKAPGSPALACERNRLREDRAHSEPLCNLLQGSSRYAAPPGPATAGLARPWRGGQCGGCPGLAFACSLKECCRNGPLFGLVFIPQECWSCLAFPRLTRCSREGVGPWGRPQAWCGEKGTHPPAGVQSRSLDLLSPCGRPVLLLVLCAKKGVAVCLLHPSAPMGTLPGCS